MQAQRCIDVPSLDIGYDFDQIVGGSSLHRTASTSFPLFGQHRLDACHRFVMRYARLGAVHRFQDLRFEPAIIAVGLLIGLEFRDEGI